MGWLIRKQLLRIQENHKKCMDSNVEYIMYVEAFPSGDGFFFSENSRFPFLSSKTNTSKFQAFIELLMKKIQLNLC